MANINLLQSLSRAIPAKSRVSVKTVSKSNGWFDTATFDAKILPFHAKTWSFHEISIRPDSLNAGHVGLGGRWHIEPTSNANVRFGARRVFRYITVILG